MEKRDGRSLSHATLEEIRIRAVQRVEAGDSPEVVVKALGFSRPRIYEWLALYREGGLEALRAKPVPGAKPKLEGKALDWLYRTITLSNPQQFKFEFALWTRAMVRELIRRQFNVAMSEVSVGRKNVDKMRAEIDEESAVLGAKAALEWAKRRQRESQKREQLQNEPQKDEQHNPKEK